MQRAADLRREGGHLADLAHLERAAQVPKGAPPQIHLAELTDGCGRGVCPGCGRGVTGDEDPREAFGRRRRR